MWTLCGCYVHVCIHVGVVGMEKRIILYKTGLNVYKTCVNVALLCYDCCFKCNECIFASKRKGHVNS
jgi:hypothetical protein